ncbi:MAG TPA: hypothetical protein VNX28_17660, partial [Gemmataceae bacterium]|nr:hypothetical protein [Gemmataceae bacterium]
MPQLPTQSASAAASTDLGESLPTIELEVSHGGRSTTYTLSHVDFLVGTVPGCDLRVPGTDLPAVLCLLARHPGGVALRKLAPTQLILVNGQTSARADLGDGDRVTLGAMDLFVRVKKPAVIETPRNHAEDIQAKDLHDQLAQFRAQVVRFREERQTFDKVKEQEQQDWQDRRADLALREQALEERVAGIKQSSSAAVSAPFEEELARKVSLVATQTADLDKQRQELATMRQELADIRRQLYDRYQERRDRLAGLQEAVDRAARKVQERKRLVDAEEQQSRQRRHEDATRRAELDIRVASLEEQAGRLEEERRLLHESHGAVQADLERKLSDLQGREEKLAGGQRDLEARLRQYQADLLRLDRLQGSLDERDKKLQEQSKDFEAKLAQLQSASADLEEQAVQLDESRTSLQQEADRFAKQKQEQDKLAADLAQRSAAVEGQQAT